MHLRPITKLQIGRTVLTIAGLTALVWLGALQANRANLLAARNAPVSQPREQLIQPDESGAAADNQNDNVSKVVGIATLIVLVGQSWIFGWQAGLMRRQADIYDRQANLMGGQQEIMASQRDLSLVTQRAWVSAVVKTAGPIKISNGEVSGFFTLEHRNSGALPAYVDRTMIEPLPWNMDRATSRDAATTGRVNAYKTGPLARQRVIFPQQSVIEPFQVVARRSEIDIARNTMAGFVLVIRGVVRYGYPGDAEVHYTTFHVHVVRVPDPAAPSDWQPLPTEDGTVVLAADLFVTNQLGQAEAT